MQITLFTNGKPNTQSVIKASISSGCGGDVVDSGPRRPGSGTEAGCAPQKIGTPRIDDSRRS